MVLSNSLGPDGSKFKVIVVAFNLIKNSTCNFIINLNMQTRNFESQA